MLYFLLSITHYTVMAADADFRMHGGSTVHVDPNTNRTTINKGGVTTPLWDGTYRMEDGSILIINKGITVPSQSILERREIPRPEEQEWTVDRIVGYSPCEDLVRRVCGGLKQCEAVEGCNLAQQLLGMEEEERAASNNRNLTTYTSGQCLSVKMDKENFPKCK